MDTVEMPVGSRARGRGASADAPLVLGRYRARERLGQGGFAAVWLAHDERLDREVAIKRMPSHERDQRALREALAAARLSHPGIVTVYEAAAEADSFYIVSELVRGSTLAELIHADALSDREILEIGIVLADALAHAHARGVIHRDVKPQNVICPDQPEDGVGIAKLTDFGVALLAGDDRLTETGDVVGTLAYMAPEQAEGRRVSGAADLYALALVIYEALTGTNPVRGAGAAATARRLGARVPPLARRRSDLPPALCVALDRALAARPQERGTLDELRAALHAALDSVGRDPERPRRAGRRASLLVPAIPAGTWPRAAAGLAAGALVAAALAGLDPGAQPSPLAAAVVVAVAVAALPRAAWFATATALVTWVAVNGQPGAAFVLVLALAPVPLVLPRDGTAWSLPALAPVLALPGLGGAYPAFAGQPASARRRAALGALGAWWLVLAEPLLGRWLLYGPAPGSWPRWAWSGSVGHAAAHALLPLLSLATLGTVALWALAAIALPWLVRGRGTALDVIGASAWTAALAFGSVQLAHALHGQLTHNGPPHALLAAIAAGVIAVLAPALRAPRRGDQAASRGRPQGRSMRRAVA